MNHITSNFAREAQIQEAVNIKANTELGAVCQSAFFCLHVSY